MTVDGLSFSLNRYRNDDEMFGAAVADFELRAAGVIEDDAPTEYSHYAQMAELEKKATADFSPAERRQIRALLGLGPFGDQHV